MDQTMKCPKCGATLPANAPSGLCPKCLLQAGLEMEGWPAAQAGADRPAPTTPPAGRFTPPEPAALAPHFPDLEIIELLGHGGMGAVYKARQTKLDRLVALKIVRPESANDPSFSERFNREAKTLARLGHPNIVAVYDFGDVTLAEGGDDDAASGKRYYFLMEYVDGANLRQLLQGGELTSQQALAIVPQICEALQFAHDEGVVHRDIKPENILVDRRGRVKIADFGLAKLVSGEAADHTLTATHQVMGTPRYMAPEQMEGSRAVDHRADIYSLGVVFYEMLTGELPLGRFDPPSSRAAVDAQWDEVVMRALEKEPQRRYQHASEVKTEVERISRQDRPPVRADAAPMQRQVEPAEAAATIPHYGLVLLGAVMATLGLALMAVATMGHIVFIWIGMGIAISGGGCFSAAFRDEARLPAGTQPNPGMLMLGGVMLLIGGGMLTYCIAQRHGYWAFHAGNPFVWIGIGLAISGGGCFSDAWKKKRIRREHAVATTPRMSRKALLGMCWAPFFFVAALLAVLPVQVTTTRPDARPSETVSAEQPDVSVRETVRHIGIAWWQWLLIFTVLPLGLSAPVGTTVLGVAAINNIRHSGGRLYGMPLAVADALFYPLLLLDCLIVAVFVGLMMLVSSLTEQSLTLVLALAFVLPVCAVVDIYFVRATWRRATLPAAKL